MDGCARPGTLLGPARPSLRESDFPGLCFLQLTPWKVVGRRRGERALRSGCSQCLVPMQHASCPPTRDAAQCPGVRGAPRWPGTAAVVPGSGSLMSCGIQRDPIHALTKTLARPLPGFQACPSNQGQHRPQGGFVLLGTEGGEGGGGEVAPGPGLSGHRGGLQGSRCKLSSLSHGIFCLKDASNSFLLFCEDNQRSFIFFGSILSPSPSTLPTYVQRR